MSEREYWDSTPRFFYARYKAWERQEQTKWERARLAGYLAAAPHFDHKRRVKITDMWRFPWDKAPKFEPVDKEAMEKFRDEAKKIFEKRFGVTINDGNSKSTQRPAGTPDQGVRQ